MTVQSRRTVGFAAILALLALPAGAQDSPAPPPPAAAGPPAVVEPPHAAPSAQQQQLSSMRASGATGPDSLGTLPQRFTDFDRGAWQYTRFPVALEMLGTLPYRIDSAAEHLLARNLLIGVADAPPGDDGGDKMLTRRVEKLLTLGNVEDAAALARALPGLPMNETLARAEIDAELLAGQIEAACIDIRAFAPTFADQWWRNGLLLCRQRAGETIEGGVPEMNAEVLGNLIRILGYPVPADPESAAPALLVASAYEPKMPPELRVEAAYAAGRASALDGEKLAEVFRSTAIRGDLPAEGGPPTDGATATLLFHAIEAAQDPAQKLALAERGLLSPKGVLDKVGGAMVASLRGVQPGPELAPLAARFASLFYAVDDIEAATPWANLAAEANMAGALWPYRVLLKQASPVGIGEWEEQSGLDSPHAARIRAVLSAFGVTKPPLPKQRVAGEDRPESALGDLLAADQSAKDLHVGETVLRAIAILGREGPTRAHPLTLRRALADLDAVQMHDEARALAFEAITATLLDRGKRP